MSGTEDQARSGHAKSAGLEKNPSESGRARVSIQELDQLTIDFADRYAMIVGSAVDEIKRGNPDADQRRRAHLIKLNGVLAVNDIASNPDPYTQVLDLVVAVTLQSTIWIDENHAEAVFGGRAPVLIRALRAMRVDAWDIAAKVLNQEQLELLDYLIADWRRSHPDVMEVAFVKFSNFAGLRASEMVAVLKAGGGFLAPLKETNLELKEYRRLVERTFWYSKRVPSIAGIQAEGAVNEILGAPEIGALIATADRLGRSAESFPNDIALERQAVLTELDARQELLTNALSDVRRIVSDANSLGLTTALITTNVRQTLAVLGDTLKIADGIGQRYGLDKPSSAPPARPFDIQAYADAVTRLNEAITNVRQLALSADQITRSEGWHRALRDLSDAADRRVDRIFHRIYMALVLAFVLGMAYRFLSSKLIRQPSTTDGKKS